LGDATFTFTLARLLELLTMELYDIKWTFNDK